jgi:predicted tellurium resistance membrane protein TerC
MTASLMRQINEAFIATIIAIEIMDLSLSVDNVVAAVAMSPKLWVVCLGVFIGISGSAISWLAPASS